MKFSNSMIAAAIGSVLALGGASQALALDASTYNEATQITLTIGGATATRPGLLNLFKLNAANNGICADGTLDIYHSADKFLMLCTGRSTGSPALPPALQGVRIAVQKSDTGGSGNGVAALVRPSLGAALPDFMNIPTGGGFLVTAACAAGVTTPATGSFASWTDHTCSDAGNVVDKVPEAGISDLEPAIFKTAFSPPLSNAELAAIPAGSISAVIFGVPVTLNVRNNMQRIQFPVSSVCNPANAAYAANAETEPCMPSLTKGQLAALFTQNYQGWDSLVGPNGDSVASPAAGSPLGSSGQVYICRRVGTSGTQAVFETQLLGQRCTLGVPSFATTAGDLLAPPQHVFENSGSGDVVNCMKARNTANQGAIGVLSMEFAPTIGGANESGYRFLKINGVAPCLLNIVESKYDFLGESTMQWVQTSIAGVSPLAGTKVTLATAVRDRIGAPAVVNDLNTSAAFQHPFCAGLGTGALMGNALANADTAPVAPFTVGGGGAGDVVAHPILTKTRGINGANSCGALIDILPTQQVN